MYRILPFMLDDIAADHKSVQESLNTACSRRGTHYFLRGLAQVESHVYFFLIPSNSGEVAEEDYVLAPVESEQPLEHEDIIGMLKDRWAAGFDLIGTIKVYDTLFMVFARHSEKKHNK